MFKFIGKKIDEYIEKLSILNPRHSLVLYNMGSFKGVLTKYSYTLLDNGKTKLILTSKPTNGVFTYPAPLPEEVEFIINNKNQSLLPYISGGDYYFYNVYQNKDVLIGSVYEYSVLEAMAEVLIKTDICKGDIDCYV